MLVVVCVFSYIMLAIITVCISNLQAFDDLLVLYNEYQEHELEQYITRPCLYWMVYVFLMYILNACHDQTKPQDFFIFCV